MAQVNPISVLKKFYKEHKLQAATMQKGSTLEYIGTIVGYNKVLNMIIILADTPNSWHTVGNQSGDYIHSQYKNCSNLFQYTTIKNISFI